MGGVPLQGGVWGGVPLQGGECGVGCHCREVCVVWGRGVGYHYREVCGGWGTTVVTVSAVEVQSSPILLRPGGWDQVVNESNTPSFQLVIVAQQCVCKQAVLVG